MYILLQNLSALLESDFSSSNTEDTKMDQFFTFWLLWIWMLWMPVGSEPNATAWIVTPERDQTIRVGGRVEMRCVATNLKENHLVEWETKDPTPISLRWGNLTNVGRDPRFVFETKQTDIGEITQEFNITNLQLTDSNKYACNVREILQSGGSEIITNSTIRLRVYSSKESFPICSPEGPITVDSGTQLNMQCSSEVGNHPIMISQGSLYTWSTGITNGKSFRSLNLTVHTSNDNLAFQCTISSVMNNSLTYSCLLGPIQVLVETDSITGTTTEETGLQTEANYPSALVTALAVGVSVGGAAAILILILICRHRGLRVTKRTSSKSSTELNSNPVISAYAANQSCVYENAVLDHQDDTQDYEHKTYHEPSQARINGGPEPEAGVLYARPSPSAKQTPTEYTPPVYAKPNKPQAPADAASDQYDEQRYNNFAFDSADPDSSTAPLGERSSATLKPTALMVPPFTKTPKKPQPYKPKGQRASDPNDGTADHQGRGESIRPKSTTSLPPTDVHALTASENPYAVPSSPSGVIMYTEVSVPQIKTSTDRDTPSPPDHLVYADLNLEPDSLEDVGQPVISEEPMAVYARVMKNRPKSEETI